LKSFFSRNSSSGSAPSTHPSENVVVLSEEMLEAAESPRDADRDAKIGDAQASVW
jgi:hypothetical protein